VRVIADALVALATIAWWLFVVLMEQAPSKRCCKSVCTKCYTTM
jgi:hypothetical protein